jgi:protein-disulfide isomerase
MADRSPLLAALIGGIVGSVVTVGIGLAVLPDSITTRIVRDGMLANPTILNETAEALRSAQFAPVLQANRAAIEKPFGSSWKGASNPDVTLVEFFDYACPYCKTSNPDVDRLLKEDKGLRVVYRELPILGPNSVTSARLSLAASKVGKFTAFHDALWAAGRPAEDTNATAAAAAGIAPLPASDAEIDAELKRNFQLAGQLGATGTPLFVIGDRVINTAIGYDGLKEAIAAARANKAG